MKKVAIGLVIIAVCGGIWAFSQSKPTPKPVVEAPKSGGNEGCFVVSKNADGSDHWECIDATP